MSDPKYTVGQRVRIRDRNENRLGIPWGEVVKVGRTLVTVQGPYSQQQYRIETGRDHRDDGFGWIQTGDEYEAELRYAELMTQLRLHGLESYNHRRLPLGLLEAVVAAADEWDRTNR